MNDIKFNKISYLRNVESTHNDCKSNLNLRTTIKLQIINFAYTYSITMQFKIKDKTNIDVKLNKTIHIQFKLIPEIIDENLQNKPSNFYAKNLLISQKIIERQSSCSYCHMELIPDLF